MNEATQQKPNLTGPIKVQGIMSISNSEFGMIRDLVYDRFGIHLTEQKKSLVVSRLQKLLRATGFDNFKEYYKYLLTDTTNKGLDQLINRITTNYSYFNREKGHFDFFTQNALPEITADLKNRNSNELRLWSAGCSTGEEPYMLIMLMKEYFGPNYGLWDAGILATDISDRVLGIAKAGVYDLDRAMKVPPALRNKYFTKTNNGSVVVRDDLKREVTYRRFNLMNTIPFKKPFHMIFCRNVMIYFDKPTTDALVKRFHSILEPGGYLFIGHSETLGREQSLFKYIMPACYQRI